MTLFDGGAMRMSVDSMHLRPTAWRYGISPGRSANEAHGVGPDTTLVLASHGRLVRTQLPVTIDPGETLFREEHILGGLRRWATAWSLDLLKNVLAVLIIVLVGIPLFFRLSIAGRLRWLDEGIARIDAGYLDTKIPVAIHDEIGRLSAAFNRMTRSLAVAKEAEQRLARELEDRVEKRTTELSRTVDTLRATQAQLVEQEKLASLGSLTAGIAHEIKNPLNFVNNFAEVNAELADELAEAIANGDTEEAAALLNDLRENAAQIARHGKRADGIVRAMMQHARGDPSQKETIAVNEFLEE